MTHAVLALTLAGAAWLAGDDPTAKPQPIPFRKADVGKVPVGWTAAHTGTGGGGAWQVVAERSAPGGEGLALAQVGASPSPVYNLCLAESPRLRDLELSVAFEAVAGDKDQGGGLVWRCRDENNYYIVRYNPLEENYRLYKVADGKRTQLATQEGLKPVQGWRTLQVKQVGDAIECHLDGKKVLTAHDNTFPDAGRVGLWTKADAKTRFATLAYRDLTKK
jgi:hypothetical protein